MNDPITASQILLDGHFQFLRYAPAELAIQTRLLQAAQEAEAQERARPSVAREPGQWSDTPSFGRVTAQLFGVDSGP